MPPVWVRRGFSPAKWVNIPELKRWDSVLAPAASDVVGVNLPAGDRNP